jgi:hypothetical protein
VLVGIVALRFGCVDLITNELIQSIRSFQKRDGSYPIFPFYYYQHKDVKENYYQGNLISTGFYLEFETLLKELTIKRKINYQKNDLIKHIKLSLKCIGQVDLEKDLLVKAEKLIAFDSDSLLIFLSARVHDDLKQAADNTTNQSLLASLQVFANIAYGIYDDINDERKNLDQLPVANIAMNMMFKQATFLPEHLLCQQKLFNCLIGLEKNFYFEKMKLSSAQPIWKNMADLSEVELLRITFEKARATAFSGYLFLDALEIKGVKIIKKIITLIYFIRQLNDDLYDCFKDLKNGQVNSANYYLLKKIAEFENKSELIKNEHYLRKIFYSEVISIVQNKIFRCIKRAQKLLLSQNSINRDGFFKNILYSYEKLLIKGARRADVVRWLDCESLKASNENLIVC